VSVVPEDQLLAVLVAREGDQFADSHHNLVIRDFTDDSNAAGC